MYKPGGRVFWGDCKVTPHNTTRQSHPPSLNTPVHASIEGLLPLPVASRRPFRWRFSALALSRGTQRNSRTTAVTPPVERSALLDTTVVILHYMWTYNTNMAYRCVWVGLRAVLACTHGCFYSLIRGNGPAAGWSFTALVFPRTVQALFLLDFSSVLKPLHSCTTPG